MRRLLSLTLLPVLLFACGKPPTPEELAASTTQDLEDFWKEAVATARLTNTMQVRDEMFANIEGLQRFPSMTRPTIPDSSGSNEAISDMKVITSRVFSETNVIQRGGTSITFRLTGKDLCTPVKGNFNADQRCIDNTDKLKISLRATAGSAGIDITLLLNDAIELGTVTVAKGISVGVVVDLGSAQKASEFVNQTLGNDSPFTQLTFVGEGKVEVKLRKHGTSDFEASVSFLSDVSGTVTDNNGITRSGKSPMRSPLTSARIDGPNKTLTAVVDVGPTEFRGRWSDFFSSKLTDAMTWSLSGLTLKATAKDGAERTVTGISTGEGPSTLKFGEVVVASFDLNTNLRRKFDLDVSTGSSGLVAITARPGITSTLAFTLQPLANAGQQIQAELLNTTYQWDFTSTDQAPKIELTRSTQSTDGAWKLVNGTVSLSSPGGGSARVFNAVTCMNFRTAQLTSQQNPLLDVFTTQTCQ